MELQNFIDNNSDYIDLFKKNNLKVKKNKNNLILVTKRYNDNSIVKEDEYWKIYCRGSIIDTNTNKLICIPPIKSELIDTIDNHLECEEVQELIDGTMINLFYHKNEWIISTRSDIRGYNKWNNKSFKDMFNECFTYEYENLIKTNCYSFVMRHVDNRNISKIDKNDLYLVEMYDLNDKIERLSSNQFPKYFKSVQNLVSLEVKSEIDNFSNDYNFNIKGYTIKKGSKRYKIINPHYEKVKSLKINYSNDLISYIELRKNGNLKDYLNYFPEKNKLFLSYRDKIHILTNELYSNYKELFIYKNKEKKDIPYHLKPFVYELHSQYLKNKKPTTWQDIKDYIHNLPSKRLVFSINYMK